MTRKSLHDEVAERMASFPPHSQERASDPIVSAKLFNAYGSGTWYLVEYDPESRIALGYVTGLAHDEWGYVPIDQLAALMFFRGIPLIEVDRYFEPKPMSECRG